METELIARANWCCIASSTATKAEIWRMYAKSWPACCWNVNRLQNFAEQHGPPEAANDGGWSKKAVNRRKNRIAGRPGGTIKNLCL